MIIGNNKSRIMEGWIMHWSAFRCLVVLALAVGIFTALSCLEEKATPTDLTRPEGRVQPPG